jgi:hypothetical protein
MHADVCWRGCAGIYRCMYYGHEVADVCWRKLTHADVCWRMLTWMRGHLGVCMTGMKWRRLWRYSIYLLYWYKRTDTDASRDACRSCRTRSSVYLLCWYKRTNTDARKACSSSTTSARSMSRFTTGMLYCCCTGASLVLYCCFTAALWLHPREACRGSHQVCMYLCMYIYNI